MATKNGKVVLITGANKGLGKEIGRQLGLLGYTVVLAARNEQAGKAAAAELVALAPNRTGVVKSGTPSTLTIIDAPFTPPAPTVTVTPPCCVNSMMRRSTSGWHAACTSTDTRNGYTFARSPR